MLYSSQRYWATRSLFSCFTLCNESRNIGSLANFFNSCNLSRFVIHSSPIFWKLRKYERKLIRAYTYHDLFWNENTINEIRRLSPATKSIIYQWITYQYIFETDNVSTLRLQWPFRLKKLSKIIRIQNWAILSTDDKEFIKFFRAKNFFHDVSMNWLWFADPSSKNEVTNGSEIV